MAIKIIDAPIINIDTRSCGTPIPFINEIRNIWTGYRICYYKDVDWVDALPFKLADLDDESKWDEVEKKLFALRDAYVDDTVKCVTKQIAFALKYGYACNSIHIEPGKDLKTVTKEEIAASAKERFDGVIDIIRNRNSVEDKGMVSAAIASIHVTNACKHIAPKLKMGHESPFEHGVITYILQYVSRSFTHQLVRCRLASYSQASQRYISEDPDNLSFVIPRSIKEDPEALKDVSDYLEGLSPLIKKLKARGIKNEDIRYVYPNAMPTDIQTTMNFRELKHLIDLRMDSHAQDEIRHVSFDLWTVMCNTMPFLWNTED